MAGGGGGGSDHKDSATVGFGAWASHPPVVRFPNVSAGVPNIHKMQPFMVKIKAGGSVNFVISGFHQLSVYDDGVEPEDINTALITPTTGTPAGIPVINDPTNRIYMGQDPSLVARDRVETVNFSEPGTYLVICGILPHFVNDSMYGWVKVRGGHHDDDDD
jgi:plastocyanin